MTATIERQNEAMVRFERFAHIALVERKLVLSGIRKAYALYKAGRYEDTTELLRLLLECGHERTGLQ